MSELFMSAIRFGTPVWACRSEYGRSPQRPIAYSNVLLFFLPSSPIATPAVSVTAAIAATARNSTLRVLITPPLSGAGTLARRPATLGIGGGPMGSGLVTGSCELRESRPALGLFDPLFPGFRAARQGITANQAYYRRRRQMAKKVHEVMTSNPQSVRPATTVR